MPNHFIAKPNTKRENQRFFLNTKEVFGIQDIVLNYQQNLIPLKFIGMGEPVIVPNGPIQGQCNVETSVVNADDYLYLTGHTGFNGYLVKSRTENTENFAFVSGYLTNYNSSCSIGDIPTVGLSFVVFGNIGRLTASESAQVSTQLTQINNGSSSFDHAIAGPGSITLNLNDFTTNRVLSYDLNVNVNRNAIYPLGTRIPSAVEINYPIEVILGFDFAVNNYTPSNLYKSPLTPRVENVQLTLKNYKTNATLLSYNFQELFLISESYRASTEGHSIVSATYRAYYGEPTSINPA